MFLGSPLAGDWIYQRPLDPPHENKDLTSEPLPVLDLCRNRHLPRTPPSGLRADMTRSSVDTRPSIDQFEHENG